MYEIIVTWKGYWCYSVSGDLLPVNQQNWYHNFYESQKAFYYFFDTYISKPIFATDGRHVYAWLALYLRSKNHWLPVTGGLMMAYPQSALLSELIYDFIGHCVLLFHVTESNSSRNDYRHSSFYCASLCHASQIVHFHQHQGRPSSSKNIMTGWRLR